MAPSCELNQNIGNCYTGSVFSSLLSLVNRVGDGLVGKRVAMFSYGSGSVASLYSFLGRAPTPGGEFTLGRIQSTTNAFERLAKRTRCSAEQFSAALDLRAANYGKAPMTPDGSLDNISAGTYYLASINEKHHREYKRK